ncbi:MAG TPA: SIR2 family protein [Steroidobacteraceae bacterium]|jgi:hypothetical protein|nr:SIR2 family protein [Steroidobacteraceae bacterium]
MTAESTKLSVLKRYSKAICHLHYAFRASRKLGLILGAGVSNDLEIPPWTQLLDSVQEEIKFDGKQQNAPESYRGEQLYQFFRMEQKKDLGRAENHISEAEVNSQWRKIVSRILYKAFLKNGQIDSDIFQRAIDGHPYFRELVKVARDLELVISHNFDNALEWSIVTDPGNPRPENRRCNTFWRPEPFLRQGMLNVYHPNGFMPIVGLKGSDSIILTELNFADLLANTNDVESHFLLGHLSNKTWLIIGHSLSDGTLKNALRTHANRRPGHINYFVHWLKDGESELPEKQRKAIREANFATYNLVTLFLSSKEIGELLRLLNMSEDDLHDALSAADLPSKYVYYICGAVSSGKSTIISHLRSIATIEEWPDRMPEEMNRPSIELKDSEEVTIDERLEVAIWRKNEEIRKIIVGLVAVDRAPLDFIAFPRDENETPFQVAVTRHSRVLRRLEQDGFKELVKGQVILVYADASSLLERQIQRGRPPTEEELRSGKAKSYLNRQSELMSEIYAEAVRSGSTVQGDSCSLVGGLQSVMRIIHFDEYRPFDFSARLQHYLATPL